MAFVTPETVPVKAGLFKGAFNDIDVVKVADKLASFSKASAISFNVSNVSGAEPINSLTTFFTYLVVATRVLLSVVSGVVEITVPVKAGLASGAFRSRAAC